MEIMSFTTISLPKLYDFPYSTEYNHRYFEENLNSKTTLEPTDFHCIGKKTAVEKGFWDNNKAK